MSSRSSLEDRPHETDAQVALEVARLLEIRDRTVERRLFRPRKVHEVLDHGDTEGLSQNFAGRKLLDGLGK